MGKAADTFSLPGFVRLAPSVFVQDAQLNSRGSHANSDPYLSSQSSFYLPPRPATKHTGSTRSRETAPPDLIIITSWTGAAAKHVAKYTAAYNALYPGVPIFVITTVLSDLTLHSTKHKLKALAPAVDYLLSRFPHTPTYPSHHSSLSSSSSSSSTSSSSSICSSSTSSFSDPFRVSYPYEPHLPSQPHQQTTPYRPSPGPLFLLHAFSEGGAHKAVLLATSYLLTTDSQTRLPLGALILDSTPGRPSFSRATTAFTRALPCQDNPLVSKVLGPGLAVGVVGVVWAGLHIRRRSSDSDGSSEKAEGGGSRSGLGSASSWKRGSFIEETRRALNDERLWDVKNIARAYLFGEEDEVVWWRDVHEHAVASAIGSGVGGEDDEAAGNEAGQGIGSLVVRFKRTEHCAHAKGVVNGAVYWDAVRKAWEMREDGGLGLRMGLGRRLSLDSLCCGEDDEGGW